MAKPQGWQGTGQFGKPSRLVQHALSSLCAAPLCDRLHVASVQQLPKQHKGDIKPISELEWRNQMSRQAILTIALTAACLACSSPLEAQVTARPTRIYWTNSPEMAMSLAKESHLPVLAFVTSEHCSYCRKMEREVWSNPQIISQVEAGFIPLKLVASRHRQLVAKLGVRAFPTTIMFTPDGKIINAAKGYMPPNRLAGLLRTARPTKVAAHALPPIE